MARILGIDYGTKRIGVSLSDDGCSMAFPHGVLDAGGDIVVKIREICEREGVVKIIIGLPQSLGTMSDTDSTMLARDFAKRLEEIGLPVEFEPEFLSTKEASSGTAEENIDAAAAAIILQSYLERRKNMVQ